MIQSQYILDILDLAIDGSEHEPLLRRQIPFLNEENNKHTGIGFWVFFQCENADEKYRITSENSLNFGDYENLREILNGITIRNPDLKLFADAIVYIENGRIASLEILNKNGEPYPLKEPVVYEVTQEWLGQSQGKTITRT